MKNQNADYAAFILRLTSGALLLAHGLLKLFVFTIPGTVGFFESLGLPAIAAYAVILLEVFGGAAMMLGIATRIIAAASIPVMLGALWAHAGNGWLFTSTGGGWEYPLFWAAVQSAIVLLGSGAWSVKIPYIENRLGKFS